MVFRFFIEGRVEGIGGGFCNPQLLNQGRKRYDFFCVKWWFFTRNTPKMFAPPSARRNFLKCAPPNLKSWIRPWQWHELPFQEFIKLLNWLKDISFLKWSGSSFQVFEAYYLKEFNPYRVVLTVGICAVLLYLILYLLCFKVTRTRRYWGDSLFIILNVLIAIVRIRLIFKEGNFDLFIFYDQIQIVLSNTYRNSSIFQEIGYIHSTEKSSRCIKIFHRFFWERVFLLQGFWSNFQFENAIF
jgi:hypothetical protein